MIVVPTPRGGVPRSPSDADTYFPDHRRPHTAWGCTELLGPLPGALQVVPTAWGCTNLREQPGDTEVVVPTPGGARLALYPALGPPRRPHRVGVYRSDVVC